jgi:hypothetical protein
MKRENFVKIDQLLGLFVKENGLESGLERTKIFNAWDQVVGQKISCLTTNKFYRDKVLFCTINSSVARDYLFTRKTLIINQINQLLKEDLVSEIVLK